jgi:hypothetical protein
MLLKKVSASSKSWRFIAKAEYVAFKGCPDGLVVEAVAKQACNGLRSLPG